MFSSSIVAALLLVSSSGLDQHTARTLRTGQLIENVVSDASAEQRYTIYLPTGFNPARPTPILYLMDPRGRARVPAKLFQPAAERFGYILISSHNTTSDGPMEPNLKAVQAMWDDSHAWFTIDPNRTYVAGFSGTARTASLLAQDRPAFTGIIGVGAGFHFSVRPSPDMRFLYFGAIGDADYNFHELQALEESLAALDVAHRLAIFSGPHAWMPADIAMRAVEWFELRAMQAGARRVDQTLVGAWWERDRAFARGRLDSGKVVDAARHYAAMSRDYAGLRDVGAIRRAASMVEASAVAKDERRRRDAKTRAWYEWAEKRMQAIASAFPEGQAAPAVSVQDLAQDLGVAALKRTAASGDGDAALEAQRRLNQLEVQLGFYLPFEAAAQSDFSRAAYYLALATEIDPASPVSWYLKAQIQARLNLAEDAIASLQQAVDAGFRDLALLQADASFRRLQTHPRFAGIVALLEREGDDRDPLTVDRPPVSVLTRPPLRQ